MILPSELQRFANRELEKALGYCGDPPPLAMVTLTFDSEVVKGWASDEILELNGNLYSVFACNTVMDRNGVKTVVTLTPYTLREGYEPTFNELNPRCLCPPKDA